MKPNKDTDGSAPSRIADARFASFETDPRFRLPSRKHAKTTIDKRFSRMLKDDDFTATAKVDRYGRKIKSDSKKKALQRLYQAEDDEDEEEGQEGASATKEDRDELVQRELQAVERDYDPARGGGFSSSDAGSDSDSDVENDEDDDEGGVNLATPGDIQRLQDEQADVEAGEVTKRIAIVNLDWDHVRSTDLFALFSSFLPASGGRIERITIYPSEFGKERMQQEEVEGPPKELFKPSQKAQDTESEDDSDEDSESEDEKIRKELLQEGDDQDFDSDALRRYQLDRLRYYYAVMVCSSPETAQKIYEATDGTEYQSSSNFLDLRFVPDEVAFDDEPRDECDKIADSYKPIEFVTNALQSSKVKLTWDMHPEEATRKESIKRAFSGSRTEVEENDLRAYLASESEDENVDEGVDDDVEEPIGNVDDEVGQPKLSKKELARRKMREALGLADKPAPKSTRDGPVGDMQVTFTPALTDAKPEKVEQEETTIEKYKRKEREKKEQRRQKAKAKRGDQDTEDAGVEEAQVKAQTHEDRGDVGFNDPFFTTEDPAPVSKSSIRKDERRKKREAREVAESASAAEKAHLTKVMTEDANDNQAEHLDHFDMNEILRMEKQKRKKSKGKSKSKKHGDKESAGGLQEEFEMDVGDERFRAVFNSHEFAIDPSNPKFKPTEGMKQLLEEGRKKRKTGDEEGSRRAKKSKKV